MRNIEIEEIEDVVLSFGVPANLKGFKYLCEGIELKISGVDKVVDGIYETIAKKNEDTIYRVERAIRYAITKIDISAWISYSNGGLKNSEVISTFALKLKRGC